MAPILRWRWLLPALAGVSLAILVSALRGSHGRAAVVPLSISIQANHFVDGAGQTIRLVGVNRVGTEYACQQGFAYSNGDIGAADAAAIAAWHADAVRIPLNEDCWLGINGQPSFGNVKGYRQAIEHYVTDLNADGLYAILDLHWTAPGSTVADGQRPMPDGHSAAFWRSVASTFKSNPAVVFDVFNEPYSPRADGFAGYPVTWACWKAGGCVLPDARDGVTPVPGQTYTAVGMQAMVDSIRGAGAHQPILLGGLSYANDLRGWLAHEPSDPDGRLAASFHTYPGQLCATQSCWDSTISPVVARVPVVTGEFDESVCNGGSFDVAYMNWADAHGVGYLAWGWWVLTPQQISDAGCRAYYLISDTAGTPAPPNGVNLHDHLAALAAGGVTTTSTTGTTAPTTPRKPTRPPEAGPRLLSFAARLHRNRRVVSFVLRASETCSVTLSAKTTYRYAGTTATARSTRVRRARVALGSVRFRLSAKKRKTITLTLSRAGRRLLARHTRVGSQIAIAMINSAGRRHVARRRTRLHVPNRAHKRR